MSVAFKNPSGIIFDKCSPKIKGANMIKYIPHINWKKKLFHRISVTFFILFLFSIISEIIRKMAPNNLVKREIETPKYKFLFPSPFVGVMTMNIMRQNTNNLPANTVRKEAEFFKINFCNNSVKLEGYNIFYRYFLSLIS